MQPTITAVFFLIAAAAGLQPGPTPSRQTPLQQQLVTNIARQAAVLSRAATPAVLAYFDSAAFRAGISNLPFAHDSSEDIVALFREQVRISRLCHNFPSSHQEGEFEADLRLLIQSEYLLNLWDATALNLTDAGPLLPTLDYVETRIFGFPSFAGGPLNCTITECQERPIYVASNLWKLSPGVPFSGELAFVFKPSEVRDLVFVAPVDTGGYSDCCWSSPAPWCGVFGVNCSAWDHSLGTLDDFDHLILPGPNFWNYSLADLFQRMFAGGLVPPAVPLASGYRFWESNFAGNILFPQGVHYLVALYPALFGTEDGLLVQQWASERGWGLTWTLGFNSDFVDPLKTMVQASQTVLDPFVPFVANITVSPQTLQRFKLNWLNIAVARSNSSQPLSHGFWETAWASFYSSDMPGELRVHDLKPWQCADTDSCFGVNDQLDCLCH